MFDKKGFNRFVNPQNFLNFFNVFTDIFSIINVTQSKFNQSK